MNSINIFKATFFTFMGFLIAVAYYEYSDRAYFSEFHKVQKSHSECLSALESERTSHKKALEDKLQLVNNFYKEYTE